MARFDISGFFDRLDIAKALFDPEGEDTTELQCRLFHETLVLCYINSVTRQLDRGKEWLIGGRVRPWNSRNSYSHEASLFYSTATNKGVLTIDVGDPDEQDKELDMISRFCLRCPSCGGESHRTGKLYEGAHVRECNSCVDTRDLDPEQIWPHYFTVPDLENRPNYASEGYSDLRTEYKSGWFDTVYNNT